MKFTRFSLVFFSATFAASLCEPALAQGLTGTVQNVLQNVPAESVFNVRTLGAKGDGRADDTAPIQAALNAAGAYFKKTKTPGTVLMPAGNYRVLPPRLGNGNRAFSIFTVASGVTVQGNGGALSNGQTSVTATQPSRLLIGENAGNYNSVFASDQNNGEGGAPSRTRVNQVVFRDFWIDQDPQRNRAATIEDREADKASHGFQFAILLKNFSDVTVERMKFSPSPGKNTVHLAGTGCVKAAVLNSYFQFVNGNANGEDYDNSALYIEARDQTIRGNIFFSDPKEGARGAIESHSGPALVENNQSDGFMTGINITSTSPVNNENNEDEAPGGFENSIIVRNNRFLKTLNAVQLWSFSRNAKTGRGAARRRLSNVRIEGNTIEMAPKLQLQAREAARRPSSSVNAIGFVRGSDNAKTLSTRDGDFENIFIINNTIIYPNETDAPIPAPATSAAIRIDPRGRLRNIHVEGNRIERAPFGALLIGGGDLPGETMAQSSIYVTQNQIIDAGYSTLFPERAAYRTPVRVYGQLQDLRIQRNRIIDRSNPPRAQYIFRNDAGDSSVDNFLTDNQIELTAPYRTRKTTKGILTGRK